jgi:hypothetical protein
MFRLAMALGRTVNELVDSMTSQEFTEWQAFFILEPWGHDVEYHRTGVVASMAYNIARGKNDRAISATDFIPGMEQPPEPLESVEDQISRMKRGFNGSR